MDFIHSQHPELFAPQFIDYRASWIDWHPIAIASERYSGSVLSFACSEVVDSYLLVVAMFVSVSTFHFVRQFHQCDSYLLVVMLMRSFFELGADSFGETPHRDFVVLPSPLAAVRCGSRRVALEQTRGGSMRSASRRTGLNERDEPPRMRLGLVGGGQLQQRLLHVLPW